MTSATSPTSEKSACERQPIRAPGAIQPGGVLLALDSVSLTVRCASENSGEVFGVGTAVPIGSTVADLFGPIAEADLRYSLENNRFLSHLSIPLSIVGKPAGMWHAVAHFQGGMLLVELESVHDSTASPADLLGTVRASVERLSSATECATFATLEQWLREGVKT